MTSFALVGFYPSIQTNPVTGPGVPQTHHHNAEVVDMKLSKVMSILAIAASSVALFSIQTAFARSFSPAGVIWLNSNACLSEISDKLNSHGFALSSSPGSADSILEVSVNPDFYSGGEQASYVATLRDGDRDRLMFSAAGSESGHNFKAVCNDVGEEIAD